MKRFFALLAMQISAMCCAATTQTATAPSATPAQRELAAAIVQDARPGYAPKETSRQLLHVRRAAALSRLALRLDDRSPLAYATLAEASVALRDPATAAEAVEGYLRQFAYNDYDWFAHWLNLRLNAAASAEERTAMLRGVAGNQDYPATVRALALVDQAAIAERRAEATLARDLCAEALTFDPDLPAAARGAVGAEGTPTPTRETELLLAMLRGNPAIADPAWDMARLCRRLGAYGQSMVFYNHVQQMAATAGQTPSRAFQLDYLNALLDAGQAERAVQEFSAQVASDPIDLTYASLLVEAYRQLGQPSRAEALIERMAGVYQSQENPETASGATAAELAWFYHRFRNRAQQAMQWAAVALSRDPKNPTIQRIWAMIMKASSEADVARSQLAQLASTDPYAAADLADYEFSQGSKETARKYLAQAADLIRERPWWADRSEWQVRPTWRYVVDVARRNNASLPEAKDATAVAELVSQFDVGYLEMGRHPERSIQVLLKPLAVNARLGEPLLVEAILTNTGQCPLPLGSWGVFMPRLLVQVSARRGDSAAPVVADTWLSWAAPRYLAPRASLHYILSVEVGAVQEALMADPLGTWEVTCTAILDPLERNGDFISSVPGLTVDPVRLQRPAFVGSDDPAAYWAGLTELVGRLRGSSESQAMRAAVATVALIKLTQEIESKKAVIGPNIASNPRKAELLSMLRFCLQEAPSTVKARTLGAMQTLKVEGIIAQLMQPCLEDPDPTVRARAADLIGMSPSYPNKGILQALAGDDPDPLVRAVASIYGQAPPPATAPATQAPASDIP